MNLRPSGREGQGERLYTCPALSSCLGVLLGGTLSPQSAEEQKENESQRRVLIKSKTSKEMLEKAKWDRAGGWLIEMCLKSLRINTVNKRLNSSCFCTCLTPVKLLPQS